MTSRYPSFAKPLFISSLVFTGGAALLSAALVASLPKGPHSKHRAPYEQSRLTVLSTSAPDLQAMPASTPAKPALQRPVTPPAASASPTQLSQEFWGVESDLRDEEQHIAARTICRADGNAGYISGYGVTVGYVVLEKLQHHSRFYFKVERQDGTPAAEANVSDDAYVAALMNKCENLTGTPNRPALSSGEIQISLTQQPQVISDMPQNMAEFRQSAASALTLPDKAIRKSTPGQARDSLLLSLSPAP